MNAILVEHYGKVSYLNLQINTNAHTSFGFQGDNKMYLPFKMQCTIRTYQYGTHLEPNHFHLKYYLPNTDVVPTYVFVAALHTKVDFSEKFVTKRLDTIHASRSVRLGNFIFYLLNFKIFL